MNIENKDKVYKEDSHLTFSCQYHIVFCPKYGRKILTGDVEVRLNELFYEIAKEYDFEIIELNIMPDYAHLLIDCNPRFGIMNAVTKLKGITSNTLRDEFPHLKRKLPSLWTRKAFMSTVGTVSIESINKYIEEQKNV